MFCYHSYIYTTKHQHNSSAALKASESSQSQQMTDDLVGNVNTRGIYTQTDKISHCIMQ